jgi:two-component system, LytTR family, response regulator
MSSLIAFQTGKTIKFVKQDDIVYCESNNSISDIILKDKIRISTYKSLKEIEMLLSDDHFVRIHAKYIVNLNFVKNFNNGGEQDLLLTNDVKLHISRRRKKEIFKKFIKL